MTMPIVEGWISAEFQRLAQIIEDYDSYLELRYTPPQFVTNENYPYHIWDTRTNYVVMVVSHLDPIEDILTKLFNIDNKNGDVLKSMNAKNAAIQAVKMRKWLDEREERVDFTSFVFNNEKNYWTHDGRKRDAEFNDLGSTKKVIDGGRS